jgi:hypothetical protein
MPQRRTSAYQCSPKERADRRYPARAWRVSSPAGRWLASQFSDETGGGGTSLRAMIGAMTQIGSAGNVQNPALSVLHSWNFHVFIKPDEDKEDALGTWWAVRGDDRYAAEDPVTLLGLATVGLFRGPHWQSTRDEPDYFDLILEEAYPD